MPNRHRVLHKYYLTSVELCGISVFSVYQYSLRITQSSAEKAQSKNQIFSSATPAAGVFYFLNKLKIPLTRAYILTLFSRFLRSIKKMLRKLYSKAVFSFFLLIKEF